MPHLKSKTNSLCNSNILYSSVIKDDLSSSINDHRHQGATSPTVAYDEASTQQWAERFQMPLFLLTQFNVHYLSWIKYPDHLLVYMKRLSHLFERVLQLPEFANVKSAELPQIQSWLVEQATLDCFAYTRQLHLRTPTVFGFTGGKKLRLSLLETAEDGMLPEATGAVIAVNRDDDADAVLLVSEKDENEGVLDRATAMQDHLATEEKLVKNDDESVEKQKAELKKTGVKEIVNFGNIKLRTDHQHVLSFNREINYSTQKHIYLKLALLDTDSPTPDREPVCINISEAVISGFSGFFQRFNIKPNKQEEDELQEQEEANSEIELELSLKWGIDSNCFDKLVTNPVAILRKLSGALLVLEGYYWPFYRDFYRWAALECEDANVRYAAIQSFHEIALLLSPETLYVDLKDVFVQMCLYGVYPLPDQLSPLPPLDATRSSSSSEAAYICEPVSLLDNLVTVFSYLYTEEQVEAVRRLVPFSSALLRVRPLFIRRLVLLLSQCLANYSAYSLEEVIMPLATGLLIQVATLVDPEAELSDPRAGRQIGWEAVSDLAALLSTLIVECVQCGRPQDWTNMDIDHPEMGTTACLLEQIIQAFFSQQCLPILKGLYKRMRSKKVLLDEHLAAFFTPERIKQYRQWV